MELCLLLLQMVDFYFVLIFMVLLCMIYIGRFVCLTGLPKIVLVIMVLGLLFYIMGKGLSP